MENPETKMNLFKFLQVSMFLGYLQQESSSINLNKLFCSRDNFCQALEHEIIILGSVVHIRTQRLFFVGGGELGG